GAQPLDVDRAGREGRGIGPGRDDPRGEDAVVTRKARQLLLGRPAQDAVRMPERGRVRRGSSGCATRPLVAFRTARARQAAGSQERQDPRSPTRTTGPAPTGSAPGGATEAVPETPPPTGCHASPAGPGRGRGRSRPRRRRTP